MGLLQIFAEIEAIDREKVDQETWGHLSPEKYVTYTFRIVYAIGCYNSQGIVILKSEYDNNLDASPWLVAAEDQFVDDISNELGITEGTIYELTGTFKNYKFNATRQILFEI